MTQLCLIYVTNLWFGSEASLKMLVLVVLEKIQSLEWGGLSKNLVKPWV